MTSLETESLDLDLHLGQIRFTARAAVFIVRDGQLLLNRFNDADFWFIPGGRIQTGESSEQAARREFLEETGASLGDLRLALVAELFGQIKGQAIHSLQFFYVAAQSPELPSGGFISDSNDGVTCAWFALADLQHLDVRPAFLVERLPALLASPEVQHVVDYRE